MTLMITRRRPPTLQERIQAFRNPPVGPRPRYPYLDTRRRKALRRQRQRPKPQLPDPRYFCGTRARLTQDEQGSSGHLFGSFGRTNAELDWRGRHLDDQTLDRIEISELMEMLADLSPEISKALWDFIRFCNPGWEVKAMQLANSEAVDERAQALIDEFLGRLQDYYGAVDVVWNQMFMTAFLRGAFFVELVPDKRGRLPLDLAVVDPNVAEYRRVEDPERGFIWQLGQMSEGNTFIPLDVPTVRYVPVDPLPGKAPYGRSPVAPAVFTAIFLLGLLHDLRRVVAQQGYPRLDLEVMIDSLKEMMPEGMEDDPAELAKWVQQVIDEIAGVFSQLQPEDAYVHTTAIKVNRPVGTVDASSLGAVDGLIRGLERMIIRALKSMPLLMGTNESTTETHANRQWEIHVAGIKALQHLAEQLLEELLALALEMQGVAAVVEFRFAELRASEELRDEQVRQMKLSNAQKAYENGWISQDEAAQQAVGHDADVPRPRLVNLVGSPDVLDFQDGQLTGGNADGEERRLWSQRALWRQIEDTRQLLEQAMGY